MTKKPKYLKNWKLWDAERTKKERSEIISQTKALLDDPRVKKGSCKIKLRTKSGDKFPYQIWVPKKCILFKWDKEFRKRFP